LISVKLLEEIQKLKSLTAGASAAGARTHNLPEKPNDIEDDGEFHYAVLGPKAASDPGKPSPEARRFLDETTSADRPRVYRNAVILAAPSRTGWKWLAAASWIIWDGRKCAHSSKRKILIRCGKKC
jgi:hypothetical protein